MPTFQSDLAVKTVKLGAAGLSDPITYQGNLRYMQATVTIPSTLAANDIIEIGTLPLGARVLPALCQFVCHADPGTTLTLDVGTTADPDAYADGSVLSAGGLVNFVTAAIPAGVLTPTTLDASTLVYATVASANTITNNSKITFLLGYVVG